MKLGLQHLFKNFRRHYEKENDESAQPAFKHLRLDDNDHPDISQEECDEEIKELQGNYVNSKAKSVTFVENIFPEAYREGERKVARTVLSSS